MKQFIYRVSNEEFADTTAFGKAWTNAQAKAKSLHEPIYRMVVDGEKVEEQVFFSFGYFNNVKFATAENIKIF